MHKLKKELIKAKQQIASAVTNANGHCYYVIRSKSVKSNLLLTERRVLREQLTTLFNNKQAIEANVSNGRRK